MPVYAFKCAECGPFDVVRPASEAAVPANCPQCGGAARRIFTPPGLALLDKPIRTALETEEKSAHEPEVTTTKRGRPLPHLDGHGHTPPWVLSH